MWTATLVTPHGMRNCVYHCFEGTAAPPFCKPMVASLAHCSMLREQAWFTLLSRADSALSQQILSYDRGSRQSGWFSNPVEIA
jgi:hypothetical protein